MMEDALRKPLPDYHWYRGLVPSWDNTARRGQRRVRRGRQLAGRVPALARRARPPVAQRAEVTEPLVFVNAWNEWAEGTHLEPDDRYGRAWLEATRDGLAEGAAANRGGAAIRKARGAIRVTGSYVSRSCPMGRI